MTFTEHENLVARLVSEAWLNKEIADRLHVSVQTVKNEIHALMVKTGARNRVELAVDFAKAGKLRVISARSGREYESRVS